MLRVGAGDRTAFDTVYDAVLPKVRQLVGRWVGEGPDRDDATQQAMIAVFENAHRYRPEVGRALPWILAVAGWEARTVLRRRGRRREAALPEAAICPEPSPEHRASEHELLRALDDVIGTLSPADQEAVLAALERTPRPEVSPSTFRKRLQRALARLQAAWESSHG
ncbi:MAG: sigma-70 family RNA polymerase sigma factor [Myxococcota bacterium]